MIQSLRWAPGGFLWRFRPEACSTFSVKVMWSGKDAEIEHGRNPHSGRLRPLALEILCVPLFAQLQKILNTAIKSEIHASQTCSCADC